MSFLLVPRLPELRNLCALSTHNYLLVHKYTGFVKYSSLARHLAQPKAALNTASMHHVIAGFSLCSLCFTFVIFLLGTLLCAVTYPDE